MRIAVIGGSGFIGTRLLGLLADTAGRYECLNIDLNPEGPFSHITEVGDVRKQEDIDRVLADIDVVVLLAAQHRDDVHPVSLYYETNVGGMEVTLRAMEKNGCRRLVFISSVAVYGIDKVNPDEDASFDPFNDYGKSKAQAEGVLKEWHVSHPSWNINIIRPTVVFGECNRGNVYNLLNQISSGRFLMVGSGRNVKSMAYVGNVVAFIRFLIENETEGYNVFNYVDKPDFDMNRLVREVGNVLGRRTLPVHFPYWMGMAGGFLFDIMARLTGRSFPVSSVRVKKFCATTEFDSHKAMSGGFHPVFTLEEGLSRTLRYEFPERCIGKHKADNGPSKG